MGSTYSRPLALAVTFGLVVGGTALMMRRKAAMRSSRQCFSVVALDLDGTALNSKHELSRATLELLRALADKGVIISFCTGRSGPAFYDHVAKLALPMGMPVVGFNGGKGVRCLPGRPVEQLFTQPISEEGTDAVLRLAETNGWLVQYYLGDEIHVACKTPTDFDFTKRYKELTGTNCHVYSESYGEVRQRGLPTKMLLMTDEPDAVLSAATTQLKQGQVNLIRGSPPFFVEVLHPDVSKGRGLELMCQALDLSPADVVAFGDGDNDIEFLQIAGLGYAMKNARNTVKAVADRVTSYTNDEDGVVVELRQLQQEGLLPST